MLLPDLTESRADRAWRGIRRWRGVVLVASAVVATIWLAVTNQLVLYIHPRYVIFTVIMAVIALVVIVASVATRQGHDHDEPESGRQKLISGLAVGVSLVLAIGLIAIPPAVLTSSTVAQRDINSSGIGAEVTSVEEVSSSPVAAFATFTVLDWASLLRQTTDVAFYADKPVDVVGFVTADPDDPENVYYVSRFIVTCCAVDAQPVGVPVYAPNWQQDLAVDDWVQVTGSFGVNPSSSSTQSIAVTADTVTPIEEPDEPYLF